MNYLFAPKSVDERQNIFHMLGEAIGPMSRLEMFENIDGFSARLRRFNNPEIVVLLGIVKDDMPEFLALSNFIRDASIIILLSDDNKETVTSAIRLKPKFIGNMDIDIDKIVPVVEKLMKKKQAEKENRPQ